MSIDNVKLLKNLDWIVIDQYGIHCIRCGNTFQINNLPVKAFSWVARGLQEAHKNCKEVKNGTA